MTSKIFKPIKIGTLELGNRVMRSATWDGTADSSGLVTEHSMAIYRELGAGGIGLIVTGYAFVSPLGQATTGQYGIYNDKMIHGWKRIVTAVHNGGGKIAMQIVHAGTNSAYLPSKGVTLAAVSSLPELTKAHREMTGEDIEGVIADFVAAGLRVREAGFDAVQLHGAHGYLMSQFVSPLTNHRTDKWGGNPENRRRFHLEVVRRLRKALGNDYPILIKFGVQDDKEGGLSLSEGLEIAGEMEKCGINAIEVSSGIGLSPTAASVKGLEPVFRERAVAVKRNVKVPVAVVNGVRSFETAKNIIETGDADMVSMSRPFIREPHLVLRWQKGETAPAKCISCNKCFPILVKEGKLECGDERRLREEKK
ncbi:MAG: NADH:flavin oxidoreductase [Dehalococcoidales bacterium]|nr:NADH:flavin oxidoreductase [Dehalococcoidales bacterium]